MTTKAENMLAKFQSLSKTTQDPQKVVTLQLKAGRDDCKAVSEENPHGAFTFKIEEGCIHQETITNHRADFICFGRWVNAL